MRHISSFYDASIWGPLNQRTLLDYCIWNINNLKFNWIFPAFEPFNFFCFTFKMFCDTGLCHTNGMKIYVLLLLNTCSEPGKMASFKLFILWVIVTYDIRGNSWANHEFTDLYNILYSFFPEKRSLVIFSSHYFFFIVGITFVPFYVFLF